MAVLPKVWDLIDRFKNRCRSMGWKAREHEDVVERGGECHLFLWIRRVNPHTFEKIVSGPLTCGVRERASYRVVHVSYLAWTLPESPPENVTRLVIERNDLSKKVAVYDLSQAYAGEPICLKLNETDSVVFEEFEKFLNTEYGLELRPRLPPLPPKHTPSEPIGLRS